MQELLKGKQALEGRQKKLREGGGKLVLTLILKRPAPCRYTSCGCGTRSGRRARCARGWCASWMAMAGVNLYSF